MSFCLDILVIKIMLAGNTQPSVAKNMALRT